MSIFLTLLRAQQNALDAAKAAENAQRDLEANGQSERAAAAIAHFIAARDQLHAAHESLLELVLMPGQRN